MHELKRITALLLVILYVNSALVTVPTTIQLTQENKPWSFEVFGNPAHRGLLTVKKGTGCDVRWMIDAGRPISNNPSYRNSTLSRSGDMISFSYKLQPCNWYHLLEDIYPSKKCEFEIALSENSGLPFGCCETQCQTNGAWVSGTNFGVVGFLVFVSVLISAN